MSLVPPETVKKLQATLHAKAKDAPNYRFYTLYDKVYRRDVLAFAYRKCRENGGAPGVDGQTFADIEAYGVDRWLDELTAHVVKRLRQWLCHKHKVRGERGTARFSDKYLHDQLGLVRLERLIRTRPWAKA
jgi:hypothetical protein